MVHIHDVIQQRFLRLDKNARNDRLTPRRCESLEMNGIVLPYQVRKMPHQTRSQPIDVDAANAQLEDDAIAVDVGRDRDRRRLRRILPELQKRRSLVSACNFEQVIELAAEIIVELLLETAKYFVLLMPETPRTSRSRLDRAGWITFHERRRPSA